MADHSAAQITVAGRLRTARDARHLLEAALQEDLGDNYDRADEPELARLAIAAHQDGNRLVLSCSNARDGQFPDFEERCREAGLRYVRADDGHYAYPPENVAWDGERTHGYGGTIETGPQATLASLSAALAKGPDALADLVTKMRAAFDLPTALVASPAALRFLAKVASRAAARQDLGDAAGGARDGARP